MNWGNLFLGIEGLIPSLVRMARGTVVKGYRKQPEKLLELYDAEYSPRCRHVRETLTELDLDVIIYPVPRQGGRFESRLKERGGKNDVPVLYDPNTGMCLDGSQAIVDYLYAEYGPEGEKAPQLFITTSILATTLRGTRGMFTRPSKGPTKLLELYSFESSPYARMARETLCELEIPYLLHNVGKGSGKLIEWWPPYFRKRWAKDYVAHTANRRALQELGGKMQVPYLLDPNTGVAMYESKVIQDYLSENYGA